MSARISEFLYTYKDDIENNRMTPLKMLNSLRSFNLNDNFTNHILDDNSIKWIMKKVISYINNIEKKSNSRQDISKKIDVLRRNYEIEIDFDTDSYYIHIISGNIGTEFIEILCKVSDVFRYDLIFGENVSYDFNPTKYLIKSNLNDLEDSDIERTFDLPFDNKYYRYSRRNIKK